MCFLLRSNPTLEPQLGTVDPRILRLGKALDLLFKLGVCTSPRLARMSVRCPEMYRHPFYPPVSRAELEKRDRLLADFRLGHEDGGAGGSSRSVVTSPKYYSSKGAASGGLLHPLFDDSADCDGPPRSGRLRVQWGSLDNAKTRNKIRRNCLGFTADGNRILAGFKDSVATINPASLSVHSSVPAQGVSFVLPHPTDANVVAVGLQVGLLSGRKDSGE